MAKVQFTYYLHDGYEAGEFQSEILEGQLGMGESEAEPLMQKIGRPFYEVTLKCELDTETGEVRVLETRL